ncbi:cytochrome b561 [Bradyrhizobium sp. LM6.11]
MMATPSALATTAADLLLVLLIVVPVAGVLLAFALGDRYVRRVAFTVIPVGLAIFPGAFSWRCRRTTVTWSICSVPGRHLLGLPCARTDCRR